MTSTIRDFSPISRSALAERTYLTEPAVSRAVSQLLDARVVTEQKLADTSGPRRKHGLALNGEFGYTLGLEYAAAWIRGVALDLANRRRLEVVEEIDLAGRRRDERTDAIAHFAARLLAEAHTSPGECLGIGVVDPGIVDRQRGRTLASSLLDDWNDVPVADAVGDATKLPVRLLNSGTAKVKAVDRLELPRPARNLLYVEYGEGIACGLKLEGSYISGSRNSAGELGHVKVPHDPRPCRCGGMGCLEAHAALPALVRRCREALSANSRSALSGAERLDGSVVLDAAAKHDLLARCVVEEGFEALGIAVAGVVSVTNPEVLVLDRTLALAGEEMRDHLVRVIRRSLLPDHWSALEIRFSELDWFIGSAGGAVDVVDALLEH